MNLHTLLKPLLPFHPTKFLWSKMLQIGNRAKNIMFTTLNVTNFLRVMNIDLSRRIGRTYHRDMGKFPCVPLAIHDTEYCMFPESGQPLNLFVPDLSELDYKDIKDKVIININNSVVTGQTFLKRTSEIDIILISNQAIQTPRRVINKILKNNQLVPIEGLISVEKIYLFEKLMVNVKEKLSDVTNKLADKKMPPQVNKAWESVKEKLPAWQNAIATKLQAFQDKINKGSPKKGV